MIPFTNSPSRYISRSLKSFSALSCEYSTRMFVAKQSTENASVATGHYPAKRKMTHNDKESRHEEIEKNIITAFKIFDHENNNSVDVREIGTILRSLGCFPSEAEIQVINEECQDEESSSYIHLDKFLPTAVKIIEDGRFPPPSYDQLLQSCTLLDSDKKGYLTWEELKNYLNSYGEPLTTEELSELASAFVDSDTQQVDYRDWITWLVPENVL